jgi:uncharacterized protein with PQ loop repeat
MPTTGLGMHHVHKRKRIHQHLEVYPHPDKFKNFVDRAALVVGFAAPLSTLPQVLQIYINHDASSISILTWSLYIFFGSFWLTYGILHKAKPIIVAYIMWTLVNSSVIIGAILYG